MYQSPLRSWPSVKEISWLLLSRTQGALKAGGSAPCTVAKASLLEIVWSCLSDPCSRPSRQPPVQLASHLLRVRPISRRLVQGLRGSTRCRHPSKVHSSRVSRAYIRFLLLKTSTKSHQGVRWLPIPLQTRWDRAAANDYFVISQSVN